MNDQEKQLLKAAKKDRTAWIGLSDWYEEQGRYLDAVKARCRAGLSRMFFQVYDPSEKTVIKEYKNIGHAKNYIKYGFESKWSKIKNKKELVIKIFEMKLYFLEDLVIKNENKIQ